MCSILLAQTLSTVSDPFYKLGALVLGALASLGLMGAVFLLIARGFWEKTGKPVIEQVFDARKNDPKHLEDQRAMVRSILTEEHNLPNSIDAHKKAVRDIIDNETQRVDGLIRKEITSQVTTMKTDIIEAIKDLKQSVVNDKRAMHDEITQFREDTIGRLGEIDGQLRVLTEK